MENKTFKVTDMTCVRCEKIIKENISALKGVDSVSVSYTDGKVNVIYDSSICSADDIEEKIKKAGYSLKSEKNITDIILVLIIIASLYVIFNTLGLNSVFNRFPEAKENMGYAVLFIVGLLTSIHCVAMCGGINLTASMGNNSSNSLLSALEYNAGRVLSYTVIGGLLGALGSLIAISLRIRAIIGILAGFFMVIMGINMLGGFNITRRLSLHLPKSVIKFFSKGGSHRGFYIGLINGLMPCGPLQSMQLLAVAQGSVIKGALSMLFFSLGTVPFMFFFGGAAAVLNKKIKGIVTTASVVVIVFFGLFMIQNNFALSGITLPELNAEEKNTAASQVKGDTQYVTTTLKPGSYDAISVKSGIPVKWTIKADEKSLNGCNSEIIIPEYNIRKKLTAGDNLIEFTPEKPGVVNFSCWMGMIKSKIVISDN